MICFTSGLFIDLLFFITFDLLCDLWPIFYLWPTSWPWSSFDLWPTFSPVTYFLTWGPFCTWDSLIDPGPTFKTKNSLFDLRPTSNLRPIFCHVTYCLIWDPFLTRDPLFDMWPTFWLETHFLTWDPFWPETNFLTLDPRFDLRPTFWPETHFLTWYPHDLSCPVYVSYARTQRGVKTIRHSDFITASALVQNSRTSQWCSLVRPKSVKCGCFSGEKHGFSSITFFIRKISKIESRCFVHHNFIHL